MQLSVMHLIMTMQVTTRELAARFSNGMEFTSTFGGCTAAGVAGRLPRYWHLICLTCLL